MDSIFKDLDLCLNIFSPSRYFTEHNFSPMVYHVILEGEFEVVAPEEVRALVDVLQGQLGGGQAGLAALPALRAQDGEGAGQVDLAPGAPHQLTGRKSPGWFFSDKKGGGRIQKSDTIQGKKRMSFLFNELVEKHDKVGKLLPLN